MVAVTRFEDLIVWQKARQLAKEVHAACATGRVAHDYALTDQMRRASVSIVSNIAEGFKRRNATYFGQFLSYARGSCAELRAQLYLASDVGWVGRVGIVATLPVSGRSRAHAWSTLPVAVSLSQTIPLISVLSH
jgi:four helix bundle protein